MEALHFPDCGCEIGFGLRDRNLRVGVVEPDEHVAAAHLVRVLDEDLAHRSADERRNLRHVRADIGVVGHRMLGPDKGVHRIIAAADQRDSGSQSGEQLLALCLCGRLLLLIDLGGRERLHFVQFLGVSVSHFDSPI